MSKIKIELQDIGQDLLYFICNDKGFVLEAGPFHNKLYEGAYIPLQSQKINKLCMVHNPPNINYGYLKYKVVNILKIEE